VNDSTRRLVRAAAVGAAAVALLVGVATVPAQAGTVEPPDPEPTVSADVEPGGEDIEPSPTVDADVEPGDVDIEPAPTPDQAEVQRLTTIQSFGVSTVVNIPPGLAGDISIRVRTGGAFPLTFGTAMYNPTTGNRFQFDWPAGNGNDRLESVVVTLDQNGIVHEFTIPNIRVTPRWNIRFYPLRVDLQGDCDTRIFGIRQDSEVRIRVADETGVRDYPLNLRGGETGYVNNWGGQRLNVSIHDGIQEPQFYFWEQDPPKINGFEGGPKEDFDPIPMALLGVEENLVEHQESTVEAFGDDCSVVLTHLRDVSLRRIVD
jgi:hypothetical protein